MERDERIATSVTPETKRRFRAEAGRRDRPMSELMRDILVDWLDEHEGEDLDEGNSKRAAMATAD